MKKTFLIITSATLALSLSLTAAHAAVTTINTAASATVTTPTTSITLKTKAKADAQLPTIISRSDTAIAARISALNALNSRVSALKNVSDSEKSTIAGDITTNINGLTALKAKIDADTDATTAKTDAKSITGSFRIYALIIPQGYVAASADRVATLSTMFRDIGTKLQARITAAQTAGKDVSAMQTAMADFNAKITDAASQGVTAEAGVNGLVPDQGNTATLQANTAALKAARSDIKTATSDFEAARKDAQSIISSLKVSGTASTNATVSTSSKTQ